MDEEKVINENTSNLEVSTPDLSSEYNVSFEDEMGEVKKEGVSDFGDGNKVTYYTAKDGTKITQYDNGNGSHSVVQDFGNGNVVETGYDSNWALTTEKETNSDGYTREKTFFPSGEVKSEKLKNYWGTTIYESKVDGDGITTTNRYDEFGNLIEGSSTKYNSEGNLSRSKIINQDESIERKYNNRGNLTSETIIKSNGETIDRKYSSTGTIVKEKNPNGYIEEKVEFPTGGVKSEKVINPMGITTYESKADEAGNTETTRYDEYGNSIESSSTKYNSEGNLSRSKTINQDESIERKYNNRGNLTSETIIKSNGETIEKKYSPTGKLVLETETTDRGKTETIYGVDGNSTQNEYDSSGKLKCSTTRKEDASGILISEEVKDGNGRMVSSTIVSNGKMTNTYFFLSGEKTVEEYSADQMSVSHYDKTGCKKSCTVNDYVNNCTIKYNSHGLIAEVVDNNTSEVTTYYYRGDKNSKDGYHLTTKVKTNEKTGEEIVSFYDDSGNQISTETRQKNEFGTEKTVSKSSISDYSSECYRIGDKSVNIYYEDGDVYISNESSLFNTDELYLKDSEFDEYYRCILEGKYQEKLDAISNMEADLALALTLTEDDMQMFKGLSGKELLSIYAYLKYGADQLKKYVAGPIKEIKVNITLLLIKLEERKLLKEQLAELLEERKNIYSALSKIKKRIIVDEELGTTKTNPSYSSKYQELVECGTKIKTIEGKLDSSEKEIKASIEKIDNVERYTAKELIFDYPI